MYLFHLLSSDNEASLTLIWVAFLGVRFEMGGVVRGGGGGITPYKNC